MWRTKSQITTFCTFACCKVGSQALVRLTYKVLFAFKLMLLSDSLFFSGQCGSPCSSSWKSSWLWHLSSYISWGQRFCPLSFSYLPLFTLRKAKGFAEKLLRNKWNLFLMMHIYELLKTSYFNHLKLEYVNPGENATRQKILRAVPPLEVEWKREWSRLFPVWLFYFPSLSLCNNTSFPLSSPGMSNISRQRILTGCFGFSPAVSWTAPAGWTRSTGWLPDTPPGWLPKLEMQ